MDYEDDIRELKKRFTNYLFDEIEWDEYKSVSFDFIYNKSCLGENSLESYDSNNDILKDLVKQYLVSKNYIMLDDSNEENILITSKGKQDYLKL